MECFFYSPFALLQIRYEAFSNSLELFLGGAGSSCEEVIESINNTFELYIFNMKGLILSHFLGKKKIFKTIAIVKWQRCLAYTLWRQQIPRTWNLWNNWWWPLGLSGKKQECLFGLSALKMEMLHHVRMESWQDIVVLGKKESCPLPSEFKGTQKAKKAEKWWSDLEW